MVDPRPVLVSGATGKQGGAVARALLTAGESVRALVRNPQSVPSRRLAELGAVLVQGDLDDVGSIKDAAAEARAVFSVQMPDMADLMGDLEVRHGRNLIEGSRAAGVEQIVHTSISGAGSMDLRDYDEDRWGAYPRHYYTSKIAIERLAKEAGFAQWTLLRPTAFMENLIRPSYYFADFTSDRILTAVDPDAPVAFVAVSDIGAAAAVAFADPARFNGVELELASDVLTYREVARIMSDALGTTITPPGGAEQARADGLLPEMAKAQEFAYRNRAVVNPEMAQAMGIRTTSFQQWVRDNLGSANAG
jgi:uncharacterized protein YbjT (DUF2867 family)